MSITAYPLECGTIRSKKTFSVTANLSRADWEPKDENVRGEAPLDVFSKFSRFTWAIVENSSTPVPSGNVHVTDLQGIIDNLDNIRREDLQFRYFMPHTAVKTDAVPVSTAFTLAIKSGTLKGKTPYEVVSADPAKSITALTQQYNWLSQQTNPKFRAANEEQMKAILDGINIAHAMTITYASTGICDGKRAADIAEEEDGDKTLKAVYETVKDKAKGSKQFSNMARASLGGLLLYNRNHSAQSDTSVREGMVVPIYTPGMRPKIRKTREDGKCFVYEICITYTIGAQYPVEVSIRNYYAPVVQRDNGTLNVQVSQMDKASLVEQSMKFTYEDFDYSIKHQEKTAERFADMHFKECFAAAERIDRNNRENAKGAAETNPFRGRPVSLFLRTVKGRKPYTEKGLCHIPCVAIETGESADLVFDDMARKSCGEKYNSLLSAAPGGVSLCVLAVQNENRYMFRGFSKVAKRAAV